MNEDRITYGASEAEVNRIEYIEDFIRLNEYVSDEKAIEQFEKVNQGQVKVLMEMPFTPSHTLGKVEEGMLVLHYINVREKNHKDFIVYVIKNTANT
ncbi:hypothetical protein [Alkalihalophilus marmarensis]|uniref:hypothetical protein n=1 Tax=Alkalihalophilus marmarensis TaxID=521377 RepID=UPI002DBBB7D2|nr:hypothetical protein [Alkalihalophilus marmarensis]MEC2074061.1 hypothetical protein [Alkalihalophilus marmarensis]